MIRRTFFPFFIFLALLSLFYALPALAYDGERTFDMLTPEENQELARLEERCFNAVREESLKLLVARFDTHTILRSFPEQIRILQQRKRPFFLEVERYLYSLRLNSEFITSYIRTLKEDTVLHALDVLIVKARNGLR